MPYIPTLFLAVRGRPVPYGASHPHGERDETSPRRDEGAQAGANALSPCLGPFYLDSIAHLMSLQARCPDLKYLNPAWYLNSINVFMHREYITHNPNYFDPVCGYSGRERV